jgi:aminoglycoside phosphotransferase (APT) family kinase protein
VSQSLPPDPARLAAWLTELVGAPVVVEQLRSPDAGMSNTTLLVDARVDGALRKLVVKLLSPASVVHRFDPAREATVLQYLYAAGAPAPAIVGIEPTGERLGRPAVAMEQVAGRSPPDVGVLGYVAGGWVSELPPEQRRTVCEAFVDALAAMHNRTSGRPCPAATHGDGSVAAMVAHWREGLLDALRGEPAPRQLAALDWLAREAPAQSAVAPALCMVDARLQNAIYDGDRVAALIDFEIAQIGNPAMDIAYFCHIHECFLQLAGLDRFDGWPSRDEIWARWSAATGRATEPGPFWAVFAGIVIAVTVSRAFRIAINSGRHPADLLADENRNRYAMMLQPMLEGLQ